MTMTMTTPNKNAIMERKMVAEFQVGSGTVLLCLAFHPNNKPWIGVGRSDGFVHIFDHEVLTRVHRFRHSSNNNAATTSDNNNNNIGVRGIDFHATEPLIVTGGEDGRIKVWDYESRRCLFSLLGHLDCLESVQFDNNHNKEEALPWILSASDDQTIRIWDYRERCCLTVLTGHNDYVTSARFCPSDPNLVVSSSLDGSLRVWDCTGLRNKKKRSLGDSKNSNNSNNNDDSWVFGSVIVKFVLEGHQAGVLQAEFHPSLPVLASCDTNYQFISWRMKETRAWVVQIFGDHEMKSADGTDTDTSTDTADVGVAASSRFFLAWTKKKTVISPSSSCVFYPSKQQASRWILTTKRDGSVGVWDPVSGDCVQTFQNEEDDEGDPKKRFRLLASHPNTKLVAASFDKGFQVWRVTETQQSRDASSQNNNASTADTLLAGMDTSEMLIDGGTMSFQKRLRHFATALLVIFGSPVWGSIAVGIIVVSCLARIICWVVAALTGKRDGPPFPWWPQRTVLEAHDGECDSFLSPEDVEEEGLELT